MGLRLFLQLLLDQLLLFIKRKISVPRVVDINIPPVIDPVIPVSSEEVFSKYFTLQSLIHSDAAIRNSIDNSPTPEITSNLKSLCTNLLDPLREKLGSPIYVTSGYRSAKLNTLIGGSKTSQHMVGKAADIHSDQHTTEELFQFIVDNMEFDQCIQEFDRWVHVSWNDDGNRKQALRAIKSNKKTKYLPA